MKMKILFFLFFMMLGFPSSGLAVTHFQLAEHYAPVIYQDTDDSGCRYDFITNVNFDGDWVGDNNWENAATYSLPASVYYNVSETSTHWFIAYTFFHPRDWTESCAWLLCHENDLEGILVVVRKDGSPYGSFVVMETKAHDNVYSYTNDPGVSKNHKSIEGKVLLVDGSHPGASIESKGHGVYSTLDDYAVEEIAEVNPANPYYDVDFAGTEGVVYRYEGTAEQPPSCSGRDIGYQLTPVIDTLWEFRLAPFGDGHLFDSPFVYNGARLGRALGDVAIGGNFDGADWTNDAASAPWSLADDDAHVYRGDWMIDSAYAVKDHLNFPGNFSLDYITNPYLDIYYDLVLENKIILSGTIKSYTAINSITAGPNFTIESGADVTFKAGNQIRLVNGFTARSGSSFHAYLE